MTPDELLGEVKRLGIRLAPEGNETLRFHAPEGALSPDLRNALIEHKAEIIAALLRPHPCVTCGKFSFRRFGTVCFWCRRAEEAPHEA